MDVLENFGMSGRTFKLVYYGNIMLWGLLVTFLVIFIILELVKDSAHSRSQDGQATADYYRLLVPDMKEILLWGYQGQGVKVNVTGLFPGHLEEYEDGFVKYNLNKYLSDRISMRRPLPDVRDVECRQVTYDLHDLPKVSVVVVFRNEPRTTLLRMLYSVVDRSPLEMIADIILVDDGTEIADLQYPRLEHYLSGLKKVRILRLTKPLGTANARMHGARNATGDAVIFLQPRCECTEGWMLPLVRAVAADNRTVAIPLVDTIDYRTFQYSPVALSDILVGSFNWELATRKRAPTKPVENATLNIDNPVAADGIFALSRDHLFRLRGFDGGLILEESVNVEFSFRCWLCGGKIVLVPCSRVGYITPRPPLQQPGAFSKAKISDSLRIADNWMGAYRSFVYERMYPPREDDPPKSIETLTKGNARCQSFDWLLQKLEPEMSFAEEIHRRGQLVLIGSQNSVLSLGVIGDSVFMQDWTSGPRTFWYHLKSGVLVTENKTCLSFVPRGNTTDQLLKTKSDFPDVNNNILEMPAFMLQRHIESQLKEAPAAGQQVQEHVTSKSLLGILFEREPQKNPHPLKSKVNSHQSSFTVNKSSLTDKKSSSMDKKSDFTDKNLSLKYDKQSSVNSRKSQPQDESMLFEAHVKSRSLLNSDLLNSSVSRSLPSSLASASQNNLSEHLEMNGLTSQEESGAQLLDTLVIKPCDTEAGGDRWSYTEEQTLQHQTSGLCLEALRNTSGNYLLRVAKCVDGSQAQKWSFVSSLMSF